MCGSTQYVTRHAQIPDNEITIEMRRLYKSDDFPRHMDYVLTPCASNFRKLKEAIDWQKQKNVSGLKNGPSRPGRGIPGRVVPGRNGFGPR